MRSATKFEIDYPKIQKLFAKAGITGVEAIEPMTEGEFNSVFSVTAGGRSYAIKIAPLDTAGILTYERGMMEQEVYYYGIMREKTGIRVPELYYSDFTKTDIPVPYFIMEKLSGSQLNKAGLSKEDKQLADKMLAGMVADLHKVKGEKFGYRQGKMYPDWHSALHGICETLISDCNKLGHNTPRGEKLLRLIDELKDELNKAECTLINFDVWWPNIFCDFDTGSLRLSWIDPERSFFGDRIGDFVCLDMMNMSLDKKAAVIESYNAASDSPITVTDNERIRFAVMLGYLAMLQDVEKYARYTPGHFGYWRNIASSAMFYERCFSLLKGLMK